MKTLIGIILLSVVLAVPVFAQCPVGAGQIDLEQGKEYQLCWKAYTEGDVLRYRVYRSDSLIVIGVEQTAVLHEDCTDVCLTPPVLVPDIGVYYIRVRAESVSGLRYPASSPVRLIVTESTLVLENLGISES